MVNEMKCRYVPFVGCGMDEKECPEPAALQCVLCGKYTFFLTLSLPGIYMVACI
jgi:hypothetical protein